MSNFDANVPPPASDAYGRPVYSGERINGAYGPILVRASLARSDYVALTAALRRRLRDGVQFQAHYTWSRDRSNDDNERAGSLTLTVPADLRDPLIFSYEQIEQNPPFHIRKVGKVRTLN